MFKLNSGLGFRVVDERKREIQFIPPFEPSSFKCVWMQICRVSFLVILCMLSTPKSLELQILT
jgi:hypothetical protein